MRATEFIVEYDQTKTLLNWQQKLANAWAKEMKSSPPNAYMTQQIAGQLLPQIEKIDPTPHKEYVQWLCRVYAAGNTKFEDLASRGSDSLIRFQKLKIKKMLKPEHRDINRYASLMELEAILGEYPNIEEQQKNKGTAKEYYRDADLRVIIPLDKDAACYYGQGTTWCTAANKNNMFEKYNKDGLLYIVIPLNAAKTYHAGEKYQFHFESDQFMDDRDTPIDLASWAKAYPQLKKIFHTQAVKNLTLPLLNNQDELLKVFESTKKSLLADTHTMIISAIETSLPSTLKDLNVIAAAPQLSDQIYRVLKEYGYLLGPSLLSQITLHALSSEDETWEVCYEPIYNWMGNYIHHRVEELLDSANPKSDYDMSEDLYSLSNGLSHDMCSHLAPFLRTRLRTPLEKIAK